VTKLEKAKAMNTCTQHIEDSGRTARSVLECGSPLPLSPSTDLVRPTESARGLAQSKTCRIALAFCFLLSAFSFQALAQTNYTIDWYTIDGGGGTSTGGTYQVSGTIGQPDASGAMTGGNYSLTGGFWSLIAAVQTGGAPVLFISHSGNTVTVYWQDVSGWTLQQNNNLATPAGWSANSGWTTSNGTNYLNITPPTGNLFFRLTQ
jgi:hypothetical protein